MAHLDDLIKFMLGLRHGKFLLLLALIQDRISILDLGLRLASELTSTAISPTIWLSTMG